MIPYPAIDPVALHLGPVSIRWYGLSYAAGLLLGWAWGLNLCRRLKLSFCVLQAINPSAVKLFSDYIPYAALGIVVGGRLGHAVFYNPSYYLTHPLEILYIWQPGMSFHGGLLGVILTTLWYVKRHRILALPFMDLLAVSSPWGLFFGRLANFINAELVGRPTHVPWAMIFPATDGQPRHPSQLYEALLEGVVLFIILNLVYVKAKWAKRYPGATAGLFGILYALSRIVVECYREPDLHIGYIWDIFTLGQLYSVPLLMAGLILFIRSRNASAHLSGFRK